MYPVPITPARVLKRHFSRPDDFTLNDHLGGSFGVWRAHDAEDGKTFHVRLRFTGYAAQTVAERRWHPSQQIKVLKKDGSAIELCLDLHTLEDVSRWVLVQLGPPCQSRRATRIKATRRR